jgi:hypothetical protein
MATHSERIRAEFAALGGRMSTRRFARHLLRRGFYSAGALEARQLRGVQADVRRALAAEGPDGLPFAQPTEADDDGDEDRPAPVWKQLALFTYAELAALLVRRRSEITRDVVRYRRLHDYCQLRFGKAPALPALGGAS